MASPRSVSVGGKPSQALMLHPVLVVPGPRRSHTYGVFVDVTLAIRHRTIVSLSPFNFAF